TPFRSRTILTVLHIQPSAWTANNHRGTGAADWTTSHRSRTPYQGTDWADTIRQVLTPGLGIARTWQRYSFVGYRSRTSDCRHRGHRSWSALLWRGRLN